MKHFFSTIKKVLHFAKKEYICYLLLCLIEVIRNIASLFGVFFGVELITTQTRESKNALILSLVVFVLCECGSILINHSMNNVEKRINGRVWTVMSLCVERWILMDSDGDHKKDVKLLYGA